MENIRPRTISVGTERNIRLLGKDKFKNNDRYFDYLVKNKECLELALRENDAILDLRVHFQNETLLHFIVGQMDLDLTDIVKPYLTEERVAAKNADGKTVLDKAITYVGHPACHQNYAHLLKVYIGFANQEALSSLKEQKHFSFPLLEYTIAETLKQLYGMTTYKDLFPSESTINLFPNLFSHPADVALTLGQLLHLKQKMIDQDNPLRGESRLFIL